MNISALPTTVLKTERLPVEDLADNPHLPEPEKVAELCRQFEAVLLRQILKQARQATFPSELVSESAVGGIYQDLINDQLAESISRSGSLGLAQSLQSELQQQVAKPPGEDPDGDAEPARPKPRSPVTHR